MGVIEKGSCSISFVIWSTLKWPECSTVHVIRPGGRSSELLEGEKFPVYIIRCIFEHLEGIYIHEYGVSSQWQSIVVVELELREETASQSDSVRGKRDSIDGDSICWRLRISPV